MTGLPDRFLLASVAAATSVALLALAVIRDGDVVLLNHSPSMPEGLYVRTTDPVSPGVVVTIRAVDAAPGVARARGFAGDGDRFLKRVAGMEGDRVCAEVSEVSLNGRALPPRRTLDADGNALPAWTGCRTLVAGEVLLLGDTADSFDGRYWGPVDVSRIEGVWKKIGG